MTEQEWQSSIDPVAMLDWVMQHRSPSDRKLRLVACAQWLEFRHLYHSKESPESRKISRQWLSYVEQAADGKITLTKAVELVLESKGVETWHLLNSSPVLAIRGMNDSRLRSPEILRDIAGNPFQTATLPHGEPCKKCKGKGDLPAGAGGAVVGRKERLPCERCHGTGHGPSPVLTPLVLQLAEAAYTVRTDTGTLDNDALAVLSDALEEAGLEGESCSRCDHKNPGRYTPDDGWGVSEKCKRCKGSGRQPNPILAHLQSHGPHYRGCWALDLILGKE